MATNRAVAPGDDEEAIKLVSTLEPFREADKPRKMWVPPLPTQTPFPGAPPTCLLDYHAEGQRGFSPKRTYLHNDHIVNMMLKMEISPSLQPISPDYSDGALICCSPCG